MAEEKTGDKTEEATVLGAADQEVLDYVTKEEEEADKLFAEINGKEPEDGKEKENKEDPEKKPDEKKEEPKEPVGDAKKEAGDKSTDGEPEDLTIDLTVENARNRISAAQTKMHDTNKRANTADKEVVRLKAETERLQGLVDQKETADVKTDTTKEPEDKTTPDEDELQASLADLSAEYPEIAKPMLKMMAKQEAENKVLKERLDKTEAKETERVKGEKEDGENAHYKIISDVHKDFMEISKEPLFDEWIEGLPVMERIGAQAIRKNGAPEDVIDLLTSYKKANGYKVPGDTPEEEKDPQKVKADSKLEKAKKLSTPTFNKAKDVNVQDRQIKFTREQLRNMSEEEWTKNEPEIDKALAEGLVG
jgi:hypothetical protein